MSRMLQILCVAGLSGLLAACGGGGGGSSSSNNNGGGSGDFGNTGELDPMLQSTLRHMLVATGLRDATLLRQAVSEIADVREYDLRALATELKRDRLHIRLADGAQHEAETLGLPFLGAYGDLIIEPSANEIAADFSDDLHPGDAVDLSRAIGAVLDDPAATAERVAEAHHLVESRFSLEHLQKPKRVRGSPILRMDRLAVPLLIAHGELDDLAAAGAGQHREKSDFLRSDRGAQTLARVSEELHSQIFRRWESGLERDERLDGIAGNLVRLADDSRLGHRGMLHQGTLDLEWSDQVRKGKLAVRAVGARAMFC